MDKDIRKMKTECRPGTSVHKTEKWNFTILQITRLKCILRWWWNIIRNLPAVVCFVITSEVGFRCDYSREITCERQIEWRGKNETNPVIQGIAAWRGQSTSEWNVICVLLVEGKAHLRSKVFFLRFTDVTPRLITGLMDPKTRLRTLSRGL